MITDVFDDQVEVYDVKKTFVKVQADDKASQVPDWKTKIFPQVQKIISKLENLTSSPIYSCSNALDDFTQCLEPDTLTYTNSEYEEGI